MENSNNEHPSVEDVNNAISILKAAVDASNRKIGSDSESLELQPGDLVDILDDISNNFADTLDNMTDTIETLTKQVKELTKEINSLKWYVIKR